MTKSEVLYSVFLTMLLLYPRLLLTQVRSETDTYRRIKAQLDAIPIIDTHDHLPPFDRLPGYVETEQGRGMNLAGLWRYSYLAWINPITPWQPRMSFDDWWAGAKDDFHNVRATSFYRYQRLAFLDLYGVDFDNLTDEQARKLNDRIFQNYRDPKWLHHVITERANIELMLNDPFWARLDFRTAYPFGVLVFNVHTLVRGFHPSEYEVPRFASDSVNPFDDPYHWARQRGLQVRSLEDYLTLLDRLFSEAKERGAVCLKTTLAYERTLFFENVPKDRAARVFGRQQTDLTPQEIQAFEDYIMWQLAELSAKYELPFQIHTGAANLPGSNPVLLVNFIKGNPKTKFILFHGGFPWIGETAAMVLDYSSHVWIDSTWLPLISYTTAKRAFREWLEVMPSNKIMWGADCQDAEGIYGATELTRRCLAEVLSEKVESGDLNEEQTVRIGRQILRDNALELFPQLKNRLWKLPD